jgi:hypothetical protein
MTDVALRMTRGAVLSGRIVDENGEPAFGVQVRALQMRTQFGERTFGPVPGAGLANEATDDRGQFRFFGLPPGEYAITAAPRLTPGEVVAMTDAEIRAIMFDLQQKRAAAQQAQQSGQYTPPVPSPTPAPTPDEEKITVAYAPVYYPGTTLASGATTVTVGAGEERQGLDFALRLVRTTTVEGIVVTPPGVSPRSVQLMMMRSMPDGAGIAGLEALAMQRVAPGPDGTFTYRAVAPGLYKITARATAAAAGRGRGAGPGAAPAAERTVTFTAAARGGETMVITPDMSGGDPNASTFWAEAEVPVDGTPISGVSLNLQPGMTMTGKVQFRAMASRPTGDVTRVRLRLSPAPTAGVRLMIGAPGFRIDGSGQFTITGLTPGRYNLSGTAPLAAGSGPGPGWILESAIVKGRDMLDFPLDIGPNDSITDAVVTFTEYRQEVSGSLQDASGRPAPDYTIVVFAADNQYWTAQSRRVQSTRPGTDGRFTVPNLPPGEYHMAAVTDVLPTEVNDPAFLEQLVSASFKFTLGPGERKSQDLKIAGGL